MYTVDFLRYRARPVFAVRTTFRCHCSVNTWEGFVFVPLPFDFLVFMTNFCCCLMFNRISLMASVLLFDNEGRLLCVGVSRDLAFRVNFGITTN